MESSPLSDVWKVARERWLDAYRASVKTLPRSSPTSPDVAHVRELVDAELEGIESLRAAMRAKRNELAPPSVLPPEVLALIFSFLAAIAPISLYTSLIGFPPRAKTIGWVSVSHVCRRWRDVCLSQSSLWTHLDLHSYFPWETFLGRAKESPLVIFGPLREPQDGISHLHLIIDHRHHIRELKLYDIPLSLLLDLSIGLCGPMPELQKLSLNMTTRNAQGKLGSFPTDFFTKFAPNLQEVSLCGFEFPWGQGAARVKSFHYRPYRGTSHNTYSLLDVAHTLQQMPALKMLQLEELPPSSPTPDKVIISLPRLEFVQLKGDNDCCWLLWSWLQMPSTAFLYIRGIVGDTASSSLIARTLQAHLRVSPSPHYSSMSLYGNDDSPVSDGFRFLLASPTVSDDMWRTPGRFAPPTIDLHAQYSGGPSIDMTRKIISGCPLENIRTLTWSSIRLEECRMFGEALRLARSVTNLTLSGRGAGYVLHALIAIEATGAAGNEPELKDSLLFPALRELTCSNVNFLDRIAHGEEYSFTFDIFKQVLRSRSLLGAPVQYLYIEGCDVLSVWIEEWEGLVERLDWDNDKGVLEEGSDDDEEDEDE
ncbi:unnamed protein product [Peniophora sp. CBMAI 1063]|nr:unnamed protein product [Peniophora sp. CBMAI 1063]